MTQTRGTKKRADIIEYIYVYRMQHGFAPSVTEIADHVGTVRSNIHHHLRLLQQEGRLTSHPHIARSWVVLDNPPPAGQ